MGDIKILTVYVYSLQAFWHTDTISWVHQVRDLSAAATLISSTQTKQVHFFLTASASTVLLLVPSYLKHLNGSFSHLKGQVSERPSLITTL